MLNALLDALMSPTTITMNSNQLLLITVNVLMLDIPKSAKAECAILLFNGPTVKAHWLSPLIRMTPCIALLYIWAA